MLKRGGFSFVCYWVAMKYTKPALPFSDQAQQLIDRGLLVDSKDELTQCLSRVNYYRLSAYWYPFKVTDQYTERHWLQLLHQSIYL